MENPIYSNFNEKELYKIRRYQNSKMEIYQYSNEPLIRPKTVTQEYNGSYEQSRVLNSCFNNISNISSLIYYSLNEEMTLNFINHKLKKNFQQDEILSRDYDIANLEIKHINFLQKIKFDKIQKDKEYQDLCKFIENPEFDFIMKTKRTIARWILSHEYLIYHPDYENIKKKYSIVLCPNYTYTEGNQENSNSNNDNDESNYEHSGVYEDIVPETEQDFLGEEEDNEQENTNNEAFNEANSEEEKESVENSNSQINN